MLGVFIKHPLTYNKALSSFGLLNNSNPPSFHSPDGDKKIELMLIFPWVEKH